MDPRGLGQWLLRERHQKQNLHTLNVLFSTAREERAAFTGDDTSFDASSDVVAEAERLFGTRATEGIAHDVGWLPSGNTREGGANRLDRED